jgi:hypothetical protein
VTPPVSGSGSGRRRGVFRPPLPSQTSERRAPRTRNARPPYFVY